MEEELLRTGGLRLQDTRIQTEEQLFVVLSDLATASVANITSGTANESEEANIIALNSASVPMPTD